MDSNVYYTEYYKTVDIKKFCAQFIFSVGEYIHFDTYLLK